MKVSRPNFSGFIPFGYQCGALDLLYNHDYSLYTPELLLSGSVGSAKSILCAHWVISHCLRWPGARVAICRQGLPDLKKTIYNEIIEHMEDSLIEGKHYKKRDNTADIKFMNGSEIIAVSFGDKRYGKVRSLKLSGIIIEEASEFDEEFYEEGGGFTQFKGRLRRIWKVPENFLICATNPDEPDHPLYKYFIEGEKNFESRYVFYSITDENPYLDPVYIRQLRQDYSPIEAERFLRGRWISIKGKGLYSAYDPDVNFINDDYKINQTLPIRVSFDFNIGESKPMSCVLFQYDPIRDIFHFFNESVIEGGYVEDIMSDLFDRGLLSIPCPMYVIHGDATGRARTPASKLGNYDIIKQFLEGKQINYEMRVPRSNPPIRTRHIKMNAYCKNDLGDVRLFVYKKAKTAHDGMRLTRLKKGANYIEDDSKEYQHITTAMGYGLVSCINHVNRQSKVIKYA